MRPLLALLLLLAISGCDPAAMGMADMFAELGNTPKPAINGPSSVTAGSTANYSFTWTGGSAPYSIFVRLHPAKAIDGGYNMDSAETTVEWESEAVSSGVSHEFTVPTPSLPEFNQLNIRVVVTDSRGRSAEAFTYVPIL